MTVGSAIYQYARKGARKEEVVEVVCCGGMTVEKAG